MPAPLNPAQFDLLLTALQRGTDSVRAGAAIALGGAQTSEAIEPLMDALEDASPFVCTCAALGLRLVGPPGLAALLAVIQDSSSKEVRARAASAIAQITDRAATEMLCSALAYSEAEVRWGAAQALGHIRAAQAVDDLARAARHDDPTTRQHAVAALGLLGHPGGVQAATTLLGDADWRLRQAAVDALGSIGTEAVVEPLFVAMQDTRWEVRKAAGDGIQKLHDSQAVPALITALSDKDKWVRQNVVEALGKLKASSAIEVLYAVALDDGEMQIRLSAAASLLQIGSHRGEKIILRTLNAPNKATRQLAALALGNAGDPRAVEPLLASKAMHGEDVTSEHGKYLFERMFAAFAQIGQPAVEPLIQALTHPLAPVRDNAAQALEHIGPPAVVPLADMLQETGNIRVLEKSITILKHIGHPQAGDALTQTLGRATRNFYPLRLGFAVLFDPTAKLRTLAADALGQIDTPKRAASLLKAAQLDPDMTVRERAARSLALAGDAEAVLKLAAPDAWAIASRTIISGSMLSAAGFLLGYILQGIGQGTWVLLAGVLLGAAFGVSDTFMARKTPIRGMLVGALLAWVLSLGAAAFPTALVALPVVLAGLPAAGSLLGLKPKPRFQWMRGIFIGAILGFVSSGISLILFR